MAKRNARSRSSDSSDPGDTALEAQKRIVKLKKQRDENIKAVVAEFDATLADLQTKALAQHEDLQHQRTDRRLHCLTEVFRLSEQRENIETQMAKVVAKAHATVEELEAMMMIGYAGRERDAASALQKAVGHQHGN